METQVKRDNAGQRRVLPGIIPFRLIVPGHALQQVRFDLVEMDTNLRHPVALANSNSLVVERLKVDGYAERRPYLVLATIAPPDVGNIVVLRHHNTL